MKGLEHIIQEEADKHANSITAAVNSAVCRVKRLADYPDYVDGLVRKAIRGMIHDYRHAEDVAMRKESREFGGEAKVKAGDAVNRVARSLYSYLIGGVTLGVIKGCQLAKIGAEEAMRAGGHDFNARLCKALEPLVSNHKTVRQCVKESKLRQLFVELQ